MSLPKNNRLSSSKSIDAVKITGNKFYTPLFTVLYKETDSNFPRFGFIVSTKVSKKAVLRNRLKRLLKEAVKMNLNTFPIRDYLFIIKKTAIESDLKDFSQAVLNLVKKI